MDYFSAHNIARFNKQLNNLNGNSVIDVLFPPSKTTMRKTQVYWILENTGNLPLKWDFLFPKNPHVRCSKYFYTTLHLHLKFVFFCHINLYIYYFILRRIPFKACVTFRLKQRYSLSRQWYLLLMQNSF